MFFIPSMQTLGALGTTKCAICSIEIGQVRYNPMKEWGVSGAVCGDCYSRRLSDHYPGDHVRVNKDAA